jgi:hypothetical protein
MSRGAESDLPGSLRHVMARGIEGRNLFEDVRGMTHISVREAIERARQEGDGDQ